MRSLAPSPRAFVPFISVDHPVTPLREVITDRQTGRSHKDRNTSFDSVGFAIEDFSVLACIHDLLKTHDCSQNPDMIADPDDPRDLFGMVLRARQP